MRATEQLSPSLPLRLQFATSLGGFNHPGWVTFGPAFFSCPAIYSQKVILKIQILK
jgi:hypothetical protein